MHSVLAVAQARFTTPFGRQKSAGDSIVEPKCGYMQHCADASAIAGPGERHRYDVMHSLIRFESALPQNYDAIDDDIYARQQRRPLFGA